MITGLQIRDARKLLGWDRDRLGDRTKLPVTTITRAESVDGEPPVTYVQAAKIQFVLEGAGVEFLPFNGERAAVRLKSTPRRGSTGP